MSKLTVTIPDDLHQKIREELERQGITTSQFIEQAITTFFEKPKGVSNMATRTLAFQVSEELLQRIKTFLARYEQIYHRKLSQKEFLVHLIERELDEAEKDYERITTEQAAEENADVDSGEPDGTEMEVDIVNRYVKVVSCNYSNSVVRLHYSILLRFFQYLAHSGYKETDLSLKMMPIVKVSASVRIPTTLDLSQIESILASVDRESPQGKRDYAVLMIAVKLGIRTSDIRNTDYAIVPLMTQVEYPADGSRTDVLLPENVTLLDYYGEPAQDMTVLHSEYAETSAAATGLYLLTDGDFTAQFVYTAPDGNLLTQNLNVVIDRSSTAAPPFADMGVAPYAGRPTPSVTSGRITKVAKVNATWLIWFNGEPAYCCTHGANGQPNGCPPYSYSHTSTVGADQCIPGDHYGNQIRIWGGLNQLSLDEDGDFPAVFCAEDEAEPSVSDFCEMIYDDLQLYIMQHYPDSRAAALYRESAEELLNGVQTYTAEAGYYTYIYQPAASGWQTVALIGPAIEGEEPEPEPEPVPQEYYADWQAPAQTAGGSFDLTFTVNTDKVQLNTLEKVDGAVITVTPSRTGGSVDGGSWQMSPAGAQTITTSGHTPDDNFHLNGGDGSATWTVHYEVSKTSTSTLSGQEGPFTSQAEADAAAEAAKNAAIGQPPDYYCSG